VEGSPPPLACEVRFCLTPVIDIVEKGRKRVGVNNYSTIFAFDQFS
jgi:hypothetical protein